MPLKGAVRYRVKETTKGPVRLAFRGKDVVEAKNLKTKARHTEAEFAAERRKEWLRCVVCGCKWKVTT